MTSWACFVMSGLNKFTAWRPISHIFLRSPFRKFEDSYTVENNEISPANNLADDSKLIPNHLISLMYIKKNSDPNIDHWGISARTGAHLEYWPLRTTLCSLSQTMFWNNLSKFPEIPRVSNSL